MRSRWLTAAVLAAMFGTACGGTDADHADATESDGVRIASFDFAESRLIAELYAQTLEAAGLDVVRLGPIGPREVVAPALEQGRVDLVPEYLGSAAQHFGATTEDLPGLAAALAPRRLQPLDAAPAEDVNVFVVTEATAGTWGVTTISDLTVGAPDFRIGGPVECPDRPYCLAGLEATYDLSFAEFVPQRNLAITAEALLRDEIEVGVMFSTSAELTSGPFVVLDDDRGLQPAENVVPVVRSDAAERWGSVMVEALNRLSRLLTTQELQTMNRSLQADEPLETVAASWLRAVGLIDL